MTYNKASTQGSLDGLCGIYSIINGFGLIVDGGLSKEERIDLFCKLTSLLDDGRPIGEIVHEGILFRKLGELIDVASRTLEANRGVAIERRTAWKIINGSIDQFWDDLSAHVDVSSNRVAILCVDGKHNHWTVVSNVSKKTLSLADSNGLSRFKRSDCDLDDSRTHRLWPTQTYLLKQS